MRLGWSFFLALAACSKLTSPPAPEPIASDTPVTMASSSAAHPVMTAPQAQREPPPAGGADVKIEDVVVGKGAEVKPGDTVSVHYTGTLLDGTKFDSSRSRGTPIVVRIGVGQVIKGWDEGIVGMRVGQVRVLKIPPDLAYGRAGSPPVIPPNATLVFEIELLDVLP